MFPGITSTKFGRAQSVPPMQIHRLHVTADPSALREVQHAVPVPVLDQEDLFAQGIDTSSVVPGAQKADALGSCTCNAGTAHLAERWTAAGRELSGITLKGAPEHLAVSAASAATTEEFAIFLYHLVTDQTGNPATEYPPTDCGSSGLCVASELEKQGLASTYKTGSGVLGTLSLLQSGTVMQGAPWFSAWMEPDSQGFVDGDGSADALRAALDSGVAGGHETLQTGIPQLAVTRAGTVDLQNTVIRVRNSWSAAWNPVLAGDYLIHASTLDYLAQYADFKAVVI